MAIYPKKGDQVCLIGAPVKDIYGRLDLRHVFTIVSILSPDKILLSRYLTAEEIKPVQQNLNCRPKHCASVTFELFHITAGM